VRIVLDTNVFVSGVFFTGPPYQILSAWHEGVVTLVISPEILAEYQRVTEALMEQFPSINADAILALLRIHADVVLAKELPNSVSEDPDDDKFLACAVASQTRVVVSGDKHLLRVSGYRDIEVVKPRAFVERYLRG
jgi:uncharacterized protein